MSGSPVIPIQFFGKTRKLSETEFAVAPVEEVEEVIEYVTSAPLIKFRASPAGENAGDRAGGFDGDIANEPSPPTPVPPERGGGDCGS